MRSIYKDFDNPPPELAEHGWQHEAVKKALYEIYHGKCAYSEVKLSFEDAGVDHYRPQFKYPQLINEWSNLLLVSKEVNIVKGGNFDIHGQDAGHLLATELKADSRKLLSEKPLLLHPEVHTPENHLILRPEGFLVGADEIGSATIKIAKLNAPTLVSQRTHLINNIRARILSLQNRFNENSISQSGELAKTLYSDNEVQELFTFLIMSARREKEFSFVHLSILNNFIYYFGEIRVPGDERKNIDFIRQLHVAINKKLNDENIYIKKEDNTNIPRILDEEFPLEVSSDFLPMSLKSFHIQKFQGLIDVEINQLPVNAQWIFLTGENGNGKTCLLRAIALGLHADKNVKDRIYADKDSTIDIVQHDSKAKISYRKILGIPERFNGNYLYFAAYGPVRLYLEDSGKSINEDEKLKHIFDEDYFLSNFENYLANISRKTGYKERYAYFINVFKMLLPELYDIEIQDNNGNDTILYLEKVSESAITNFRPRTFSELASGFRNILALVGDIIIRLSQKRNEDNGEPSLEGIVIIDEIDAHLHPKYQKHFVATLTKLFPKVQFIASTHSPIPLLGAPYNTVILNVSRESVKEGIKVERLDEKIDFKRLTPEALLTSPIFGFRDIISDALGDDYKLLETESDYEKIAENNKIKEELRNLNPEQIEKLKKVFTG
ncbi:MAG: AAA family ATPase [Leptospiraceae bacterium]|nr:AAA family ATPase [Leptospiraceae bacterium]